MAGSDWPGISYEDLKVKFCADYGVSSFIEWSELSDAERKRRGDIEWQRTLERFGKQPVPEPQAEILNYKTLYKVLKRDHYTCQRCGRRGSDAGVELEVDHKVPRARGGTNDMTNLWTLCKRCNRHKSARWSD